jgi:hypothetical protein
MVAPKNLKAESAEVVERTKLTLSLLPIIDLISRSTDEINTGEYWAAYRSINEAELLLGEIALQLHDLDCREDDKP